MRFSFKKSSLEMSRKEFEELSRKRFIEMQTSVYETEKRLSRVQFFAHRMIDEYAAQCLPQIGHLIDELRAI